MERELLRKLLHYDAESGVFTWLVVPPRCKSRISVGDVAGCLRPDGYWTIKIAGQHYLGHRLACLCIVGRWPLNEMDHVNGVRSDNRWVNLREATHSQNQQNLPLNKSNTSGVVGVSWDRRSKAWVAHIQVDHRSTTLGYFKEKGRAVTARLAAKARLHQFQPTTRTA